MSIRAISTPNIAFIKYWGNRNDELRLPAADSLSMTLEQPVVEVVVDHAELFSAHSFETDGTERIVTDKESIRLEKHFLLTKRYFVDIGEVEAFPASVSLEIRSGIPKSVGLASSAAVFSALAEAYGVFVKDLSRRDVSVLARLGSGSASRSVFGGFVAMVAGNGEGIDSSYAQQIAPESHWKLSDIILVPSNDEKVIGSTEGHALAYTSPLFKKRIQDVCQRQKDCIDAIMRKDFEKLQYVAEEDCLDMHAVMESSTPRLQYVSAETRRIVQEVKDLRSREGIGVLYTMDAGSTVHLICEEGAIESVRAFARAQTHCTVYEAGIGGGSHILES